MKRHFHKVELIGNYENTGKPVLVLSNHYSWWDGFWLMYINLKVLKRKFHFMMLEEQLRKFWFFNYTGGFSVNKNSRSIIETIRYTVDLLSNKNNMVLVFPQGEIQSQHKNTIRFEKGIEKILNTTQNEVQILFVANFTEYFSEPKPSLFINFKEYKSTDYSTKVIEEAYNKFYTEKKQLLERHASCPL